MSPGLALARLDDPSECPEVLEVQRAREILAAVTSIGSVREIRDKAEALRAYRRVSGESLEAQNRAAEVKLWAERRAGELLKGMPKHEGGRPPKTTDIVSEVSSVPLAEVGISHHQSSRWQKLACIPESEFESHIEQTKAAGKELTTAATLKLAARQPVTYPIADCPETRGGDIVATLQELIDAGRKFHTIYADPPWPYDNQATRASTDNHYATMTVDQICAEPVRELVEDDAHLHLWTTNAFLFDARRIMEAWGFEYKSCFIWIKPQMGIGNYWRVSHEFLLFGKRGRLPFRARDERSWVQLDRAEHSAKPDEIRLKVEKVSPGPYLEMYGRAAIPNSAWTVYGNQIGRKFF